MVDRMLSINGMYTDNNTVIKVGREVKEDSDLQMIVGEIIYAIETQCHKFSTHDIFQSVVIPNNFTLNCTLVSINKDDFSLRVTLARKRKHCKHKTNS